MSDNYADMYGMEENEDATPSTQSPVINLQSRGMIREIEIDGNKISVVDASVVIRLENTIRNMQTVISRLENDIRNINNRITTNERRVSALNVELDNKVSYE
jgi:hypothetical protein